MIEYRDGITDSAPRGTRKDPPLRALVIEDHPKMAASIKAVLEQSGVSTDIADSAASGHLAALGKQHQVILMDVMLPDGDGVELCRKLRQSSISTPIIMLSALDGVEDRIMGLDAGADDFVPKPFKAPELLARVRAVVRRCEPVPPSVLSCDDLVLDLSTRSLSRGDVQSPLSSREHDLLVYFLRNQNRVLSREQIAERVWSTSLPSSSNVIEVYISSLRKKIQPPGTRPLLHTIKRTGYRLGIID